MKNKKKPKIGLALGSGGAKGLSHIGVIKELEKNKIKIDYVAGSSIGALIGGVYAINRDVKEIEDVVLGTDWKKIISLVDITFKGGIIKGGKVRKFIEKYVGKSKFKDLKTPLCVIATDIESGKPVIIDKGYIIDAIMASIAFPLVFKPVEHKSKALSDGGLSIPVPAEVVRKMGAETVVAVNLDANYFEKEDKRLKKGLYEIANNSLNILRYHLSFHNSKEADIVICPKTGDISWDKFAKGEKVILAGENAMKKEMRELKKIINF